MKRKKLLYYLAAVFIILGVIFVSYTFFKTTHSYVGKVNGEPITASFFKSKLVSERSNTYDYFYKKYGAEDSEFFWSTSFDGEIPIEYIKKNVLKKCIEITVLQQLAKSKGIVSDIDYNSFLKDLKKENERRKKAIKKGEIIYGPVSYTENTYFDYVLSNTIISLKVKLSDEDFKITDTDVEKSYKEKKSKFNFMNIKVVKISVSYDGDKDESAEKEIIRHKLEDIRASWPNNANMPKMIEKDKSIQVEELLLDNKFSKEQFLKTYISREVSSSLNIGEISSIFDENGALCILKVLDSTKAEYPELNSIKDSIEKELINEKYNELVEKLVSQAKVELYEGVYSKIIVE